MKKTLLLTAAFIIACVQFASSQNTKRKESADSVIIKGIVLKGSSPLSGASISINSHITLMTQETGKFLVKVPVGSQLTFTAKGLTSQTFTATKSEDALLVDLDENNEDLNNLLAEKALSNKSYWSGASMGASIGYNVNSTKGGSNNIVGGATVIINPMSQKYAKTEFAIVGNIANYMNTLSTTTTNTDLSKLAQDNNGLSVGIGGTREFLLGSDKEVAFRIYGYTMYQLNSFQKTGDTTATPLSQWKNTLGIELEGFTFKQGGVMTFGVSASYGIFDAGAYQKVFNEKKASITSLETTVILPISNQFGFMFSGTYSRSFSPVFLLGIVIKTIDFSKTSLGANRHSN